MMRTMISLKGFIIPNHAYPIDMKFDFNHNLATWETEVAKLNGVDYKPDTTPLLELWYHNDETENFCRHGGIMVDGKHYWSTRMEYLPVTLFEGKKEGDVISVTVPFIMDDGSEELVNVNIELSQYSAATISDKAKYIFGPFEETLKKVS